MKETIIHHHMSALMASTAGPFVLSVDEVSEYKALAALGIGLDDRSLQTMYAAMDANVLTPTVMAGNLGVPAQFLQNWLPGLVRTITQSRKIDMLVGISTAGNWEDEEVIQGVLEPTGLAVPYGDYTNVPLSSFNLSYERRGVVRFEQGIRVGKLEEARMGRVNVNAATEKRGAAAVSLDILRNRVGFYGYNGGVNRVFGFLNDPGLPAYTTVPAGAGGGTTWASKTFLEITADIRSAMATLQSQSGDLIDPTTTQLVLAVATNASQFLAVTSEFGNSVRAWLTETYNVRIVTAPELNGANGGANVFYLYPETVQDGSTDGGKVFDQIVPTRFQTLGVEQQAKAYIEDYTNATAGVMVKRPWAIVRRTGI
jgi:hypothetical protein